MRKLKAELSPTLFSRDGRNLVLTPEGEDLMHPVERGFAELWRGVQSASAHPAGLLRLHCAPSFAAKWLGPRLARFLRECPGIEVRLAASTDDVRFAPREYDADIAYGRPRLDGLVVVPLGEEQVAPLCTPALAQRIAAPSDLLRTPLIESDNKKIRRDAWFAANGLVAPAPHRPRFDRSFLAIAAAVDGLGVALETHRLASTSCATGAWSRRCRRRWRCGMLVIT